MAISDRVPIYCKATRKTRLCMRRKRTRYGNPYRYKPRADFLRRLAQETGNSIEQIKEQIQEERRYLLENPWIPFNLRPGD
jgi:hypothetical protein